MSGNLYIRQRSVPASARNGAYTIEAAAGSSGGSTGASFQGVSKFSELSDVKITSPVKGQFSYFDGYYWVNTDLITYNPDTNTFWFKGNIASEKAVVARAANTTIPSVWDSLPLATATSKGGVIIGATLSIVDGVVNVASGVGSQTLTFANNTLSISGGNSVSLASLTPDLSGYLSTSGQAYDSARLAGVVASNYPRRDVAETINANWIFQHVAVGDRVAWGGSTYPSVWGTSSINEHTMFHNPHVCWKEYGQRGYVGNTYGAITRYEGQNASTSYWDLGVSSRNADTFSISRIGSDKFLIDSAGHVGIGRFPLESGLVIYNDSGRGHLELYQTAAGTYNPSILFHKDGTFWGNINYDGSYYNFREGRIVDGGLFKPIQFAANSMIRGANGTGGRRLLTYDLNMDSQAYMGLGTDMAGGPYEHSLFFPGVSSGRCTIGTYNGTTYSPKLWVFNDGTVRLSNNTGDCLQLYGTSTDASANLAYISIRTSDGVRRGWFGDGYGSGAHIAIGNDITGKILQLNSNGKLYYDGDIVATNCGVYSTVTGIVKTDASSGYGISLWSSGYQSCNSNMPDYGLFFASTSTFGGHGGVTAYATYFTTNSDAGAVGWIFKKVNGGGANVLSIDANGNLLASGAVVARTASDVRLKTNIRSITDAMSVIRRLNPVEYDWNEKAMTLNPEWRKNPHSASFIAHEYEQVFPWAMGTIFGKYQSIDQTILNAYVVAGMNQIDSRQTEQEREINRLKEQVSELKMKLNSLNVA